MKRLFSIFALLLMFGAFASLPAFAQSKHVTQAHVSSQSQRPLSTIPYCYGDGWGQYQPCDGKPVQNHTNCPRESLVQSKAIGSSNQGQIGTLNLFFSGNTSQLPWGCNAWHAAINITHSGCYPVQTLEMLEPAADHSYESNYSINGVCNGQWLNTTMVGDWQPGGCYYADSIVLDSAGIGQTTSTSTFCY